MRYRFLSFCAILFLSAAVPARGQEKTIYYDESHKKTDSKHAKYYAVYTPEDNKYKIMEYTAADNKTAIMGGYYLTLDSESRDGFFTFYEGGYKSKEGAYIKNKKTGAWNNYYPNSTQMWYVEEYTNGALIALTSFYEDGNKKRRETYADGQPAIGTCYGENGAPVPFTPFFVMPLPAYDFNSYLMSNLHYPEKARENKITGRVVVRFFVDTDGSIKDVSVVKHLGGGCDAEAVRVITKMPNWAPGKKDDAPAKMMFTKTINFNLQ